MVDADGAGPPDDGPGADSRAPEEARASSADGAPAPLDGSVVHAKFGGKRARRKADAADDAASSGPPTPLKSAVAREKGDRGDGDAGPTDDAPARPKKKAEKTIDWGRFNHLCENFVLIYGTDTVWDASERLIMKISAMSHAHGSDMVKMWKASDRRRTVRQDDVVFDPTMKCDQDTTINLFDGFKLKPRKGDYMPMVDLVQFLTSRCCDTADECDAIMHWLLCWLAYPLQHPGAKLRTSVIMHGDEGAGKNFLFDTIVSIYGKYGTLVGQDELEDKFNDWRSGKLFVVGDEVSSRAELVHNKNRLKALITSETVQINPKNLPRREEKNQMNIVFLSNELQPLALDNSDRRYLVVYTPLPRERAFYAKLREWREKGGAKAFYRYLLDYPTQDFDPFAPAPMTSAKQALISINRKSPEQFWAEWSEGELDLPYQSCSLAQAFQAYQKWCQRTGERYPFKREQWTPTLLRFSEGQGKPARVKVMKLDALGNGVKKAERMLLVTDPPDNVPQGEWATQAVASFAPYLRDYLGWQPRSPAGDESGQGENS